MTGLNQKLWRDLWRMKSQAISIALVLASGVTALITFMSTSDSIKLAQSRFYHESRFADVFAELKRAPLSLKKPLSHIPGVVSLETRIVKDFLLHMPDRVEAAVGRFISLPETGQSQLNRLYLRTGRWLDPNRPEEVLVSEGMAEANGFHPGDKVAAIVNGRYKKFTIVGTVLSPEYVYAIRGETPIPDDKNFGIFYTSRRGLEAALDMEGSFNSLTLKVGPGGNLPQIIDQIDQIILPYGGLGTYARVDQISNVFLSDEISTLRVMGMAIPLIFFAVSVFLLNVVMNRMISLQRSQIATLKALGYRNRSISFHYTKFAVLIVLASLVLGIPLGWAFGQQYTRFYTDFFRFPFMTYFLSPRLIFAAFGVGLFSGTVGVFAALRKVFKMRPAEALRPPVPPAFHQNLWERLGISHFLSTRGKMVFRNLTLHPLRTFLGMVGIAFGVMITMLGLFWWDTIHFIIHSQFQVAQRQDVSVVFSDHLSEKSLQELTHLPGVLSVEGYRAIPIRIRNGHYHEKTALLGYPRNPKLQQLLNDRLEPVPLPAEGILIGRLLSDRIQAKPGDILEVEVLEGKRQKWSLPLAGLVDQWIGFAAYMELGSLQSLLDDNLISTASLTIDPNKENALLKELKAMPKVAAVNLKKNTIHSFRNTMVTFLIVFATALTAFALVIALGVVYNNARISLSERTWELMSLRVLGFSRGEVFRILSGEVLFQLFFALPLGWVLGYLFAWVLVKLTNTESLDLPIVIEPNTYAHASLVILVAGALSLWIIRNRLNKTDLVSALKVRE